MHKGSACAFGRARKGIVQSLRELIHSAENFIDNIPPFGSMSSSRSTTRFRVRG